MNSDTRVRYARLKKGLTQQELADKLGVSPQYLSKLFHQEVGMKLSEYIMSKRVQAAENMLKYSEYSPLDIGNYLGFSSHSHFISSFRRHTGFTPRKYRENFFRMNWQSSEKETDVPDGTDGE